MKNWIGQVWQSFLHVSLWLVSIGLMISSSGIDGAYLTKLMPAGWGWLGLVLNTTADIGSEIGMYWYGRLKQAGRKKIWPILVVQVILVGYAWLFGWRQLVPIVKELEPVGHQVYAGIMAAFIPVALVGIGYTQALLAGRVVSANARPIAAKEERVAVPVDEPAPIADEPKNEPAEVEDKLAGEALREAILDAKRSNPALTYNELAAQFGRAQSTVGYHVRALHEAGKLNGGQ